METRPDGHSAGGRRLTVWLSTRRAGLPQHNVFDYFKIECLDQVPTDSAAFHKSLTRPLSTRSRSEALPTDKTRSIRVHVSLKTADLCTFDVSPCTNHHKGLSGSWCA